MIGSGVTDMRCEALFASGLQRAEAWDARAVLDAIDAAVSRYGVEGCAGVMAQEFGEHPEAAVDRMRWVRQAVGALVGESARRLPCPDRWAVAGLSRAA